MKKIFSILFCLLALHAMADNRLYINDFSINPGETVDVSIMLDNEVTDFASFQADLYLPEGLELVEQYNEEDDEYFTFSLTTRAKSRMAIGSAVQADGAVRLMLTQTIGSTVQTIRDTSGALVTFKLKACDSFSGTTSNQQTIVICPVCRELFISDIMNTYTFQQKSSGLYLALDAANDKVMISETAQAFTFEAGEGGYYLTNEEGAVGFAGTTNWTMSANAEKKMIINPTPVEIDGVVYYTLNEAKGMIATDNETDGSPCYTDKSVAKSGDKAYWTIAKVEAEHSEPYVALRNIVFSTATSVRYSLDDTQTTVTVGGSTPATGLTVSSNSLNLLTGTSQALVVSPSPANATWTSSDPLVATVTNDGVVTGVKQGSATITCTVNGQSSTPFPVTVISLGDINRDGNISIADVTALVNIILGKP